MRARSIAMAVVSWLFGCMQPLCLMELFSMFGNFTLVANGGVRWCTAIATCLTTDGAAATVWPARKLKRAGHKARARLIWLVYKGKAQRPHSCALLVIHRRHNDGHCPHYSAASTATLCNSLNRRRKKLGPPHGQATHNRQANSAKTEHANTRNCSRHALLHCHNVPASPQRLPCPNQKAHEEGWHPPGAA